MQAFPPILREAAATKPSSFPLWAGRGKPISDPLEKGQKIPITREEFELLRCQVPEPQDNVLPGRVLWKGRRPRVIREPQSAGSATTTGKKVAGGMSPLPSPVPGHPERCCGQRGSASFHPQPVLGTNIALREPENTEFQAKCHKAERWSHLEAVRALLGKKHKPARCPCPAPYRDGPCKQVVARNEEKPHLLHLRRAEVPQQVVEGLLVPQPVGKTWQHQLHLPTEPQRRETTRRGRPQRSRGDDEGRAS